ncbi:MAG: cytochrome c biogenesis protein CcdA, partial [Dehalococcoidia bacterium]|nr:cytochrome c biogenesis protein CcdA [Dehalococcoidia bacterium]
MEPSLNVGSALFAVVAGLLSFISPCILPLLPAYLGYMSGVSFAELHDASRARGKVVASSILFVAGLATTFTLLGATATALGQLLVAYQPVIAQLAGLIIIALGLQMIGVFRVPFADRYLRIDGAAATGRAGAFVMGAAFGVGWTPCVGPFLAGVLTLASQEATVWQGIVLLLLFALGLGVPFVLSALAFDRAMGLLARVKRQLGVVTRLSGAVLVIMGVVVFSG